MTTASKKGTWEDEAIVSDPRIDHDNEVVRITAEKLHANESMHMHLYVGSDICPYCALRATRVLRWATEFNAGKPLTHDTPFGSGW